MFSLEEKLAPPHTDQPWNRDALGVGLLIALAVALQPRWRMGGDWSRFITDVAGQMVSFYLLPAMGFCLALWRSAVDLSVWISASLGGVVAAGLINEGYSPGWAFVAGGIAGLLIGAINATLVAWARLPSLIVTLAVAFLIMAGMQT